MTALATAQVPMLMLDTNIVSDLMRNPKGQSHQRLQQRKIAVPDLEVCISLVVDCEICFGLARKPSKPLSKAYADLLRAIDILPLEPSVTRHYASIRAHLERAGTPIGPNDTLIAAHALALDAMLVSSDVEFQRVPGLKLEHWLQ